MMKTNTISAWQTAILIFILLFANKVMILPSLLYEQAGILSFLIVFLLFAFDFAILFLFYKLKKRFPDKSFSYLLNKYCGKFWKGFIYVLMMLFFFGKTVLLYNITYIFFVNTVYNGGENFMFLICILPIVVYLSVMGLRVLARTTQLFFPVIVSIVVLCIVVGYFGITDIPLINPETTKKFAIATLKHMSAFGDMIFLFLFMDKIQIKKGQWKVIFSLSAVSAVLVGLISVIFIFSFTYTSYMHPFALFEIMSYVKEFNGVGRVDIISMVGIILLTYFQLSIYFISFLQAYKTLFKTKEFYAIVSFFLLFFIVTNYFILNLEKAIMFGENSSLFFGSIAFLIIPIFLVILLCKKEVKRE